MAKESKIRLFVYIIISGFIISVLYHLMQVFFWGKPNFPYNTFLFDPADRFNDFINLCKKPEISSYYPFANVFISLFSYIKPLNLSLLFFLLFSSIGIVLYFWTYLHGDSFRKSIFNTFVFFCCSFPVLFLLDRANFESFVFFSLCLFIYFFQKKQYAYSIIPLSCAIAMKLFPAFLLILFISNRTYKYILWTILFVLFLSFFSTWMLYGSIENYITLYKQNTKGLIDAYIIGDMGLDYGHSLFGLLKLVLRATQSRDYWIQCKLNQYTFVTLVIACCISLYTIFIEQEFWKKVTLIVIGFCLLPQMSGAYKLMHFFIPIFLFINAKEMKLDFVLKKKKFWTNNKLFDYFYCILFALLLIPKNYRYFFNNMSRSWYWEPISQSLKECVCCYAGVYIDPIIMLILAFLIMGSGMMTFDFYNQTKNNSIMKRYKVKGKSEK